MAADAGYDFVADDSNPSPPSDHGTHVGGTVAAVTNNERGIAGMSEASLQSLRALTPGGGRTSAVVESIQWATDQGVDVINMSIGGRSPSETLKNAVPYAHRNGVILVAAAGNSGASSVGYPASSDEVIAVGASTPSSTIPS